MSSGMAFLTHGNYIKPVFLLVSKMVVVCDRLLFAIVTFLSEDWRESSIFDLILNGGSGFYMGNISPTSRLSFFGSRILSLCISSSLRLIPFGVGCLSGTRFTPSARSFIGTPLAQAGMTISSIGAFMELGDRFRFLAGGTSLYSHGCMLP